MAIILVVEDRVIDRDYLVTLLGYYGHRVIQAGDGAQALDETSRHRPDLIVSDVLMPTLDGFEFVRRLRALPDVAQTPVIFYAAAYHESEARQLAATCKISGILTKPAEPTVILATINAVLGRSSSVNPPPPAAFDKKQVRVVSKKVLEAHRQLELSEQRWVAVANLCHSFNGQRDLLRLLQDVCAAGRDATFAGYATLGIVNEIGGGLTYLLNAGAESGSRHSADPLGFVDPLLQPVLKDRLSVRWPKRGGHPEEVGSPPAGAGVKSYLAVPIASSTKVYGWIGLQNKLGAAHFSEGDERVATVIGAHAGIAYENFRLIADLQQRAEEFRINEERTLFALEAAHMGVWDLNLATWRMTWSEGMTHIFGLSREQAPATVEAFLDVIHPDDRQRVQNSMAEAARGRTDYKVEFRVPLPDGNTRWVAGAARVFRDVDDTPMRLVGVGADVSERKSLEAQFRQAQKMEAVGQLAGGVAHDFNNLLTVILGYSDIVVDSFGPQDKRIEDMGRVLNAGRRAASLTKQLLAFSRKQVLRLTVVDLNALVTNMREMVSRLISEQVELVTILAPDLGAVRADSGQIEQVLMNLIVNARDAMPSGGSLVLKTANIELDEPCVMQSAAVPAGAYVTLEVTDSGTGMNEATKQRLFEPFFTTKDKKGTGLGLATVYGIVKQSNGFIWVYSELGKGTTFKLYLPCVKGEDVAKPSAVRDEITRAANETVLLVEDEESVRSLTRTILERGGYRVLDAENAQQAEALFEKHKDRINLLVTDVIMPGLTGPELFKRLLSQLPDLKVLYVSGYVDALIVPEDQLDAGVKLLQKPFSAAALYRKVREVLNGDAAS